MTTKVLRTMVLLVLVVNLVPQTATAALGQARHKQTTQLPQTFQQDTSYESDLLQNQVDEALEDASAVAAGAEHTCAFTSSGGVECWGNNGSGQLGDGTTTQHSTPVDVVGLSSGVVALAAGTSHTCAVTNSGGVKCWGENYYGQLGDGTTTWRNTPVDVVGLSSDVIALAAGWLHTCALTSDGGVKCWGDNSYGQLGDGSTTQRSTPIDVVGLSSGVSAVAVGYYHTCALTSSGGVKCWGANDWGQLGNGTTTHRSIPVDVVGLSSGVTALAAGGYHTCALTSSGGVKCWGWNSHGQLGDGTTMWWRNTPVDVVGLSSGVSVLAAGGYHTCALTSSGGVKCWGSNYYGQLGDGSTTSSATPVDVVGLSSVVSALAAGGHHTCALTSSSGVKCWGGNSSGQLGDGAITQRNTPVDVVGLSNGVTALTVGWNHTCALTNSESVKCWGGNSSGQLGDGTTTQRSTPVDVVGLSSGVSALAAGGQHTCALTSDGGVKCWGYNCSGQLGDGTTTQRNTPVDVVGLSSGVIALAAGGDHTCALTSSGGVKCWGLNFYGQLGDGTTTWRSTPVDVVGLSRGIIALTAGWLHTCALTSSGGVKCWGSNFSGQLGDGTTTQYSTPVDVVGLSSDVIALAAGWPHTCALTSSGGAKCWGGNSSGQLGDGTTTQHSTPVDVVGLNSGVTALAADHSHTCALSSGGGAKCWGSNSYGKLGDGTTIQRSTPVDVVGLSSGVSALTVGHSHTCALTSSGCVKCWGCDGYGQLGLGTIVYRTTPVDVVGFELETFDVIGMEVTQGIQCFQSDYDPPCSDNSVPLVSGKFTAVRVHLQSNTDTSVSVEGTLFASNGTLTMTIQPENALAVAQPNRGIDQHALRFLLEEPMLQGTINLWVELNTPGSSTTVRYPESAGQLATFNDVQPLSIGYELVNYNWLELPDPRVNSAETYLRTVYPQAKTNYFYVGTIPFFSLKPNTRERASELINRLDRLAISYDIDGWPEPNGKPDQFFGWVSETAWGILDGLSHPVWAGGNGFVAFGTDSATNQVYEKIMAHEIGHNLGLRHPFSEKPKELQNPPDICDLDDTGWPHDNNDDEDYDFEIHDVGYDFGYYAFFEPPVSLPLIPVNTEEFMQGGHCEANGLGVQWVSAYNYNHLYQVLRVLGGGNVQSPTSINLFDPGEQVLLVSGTIYTDTTAELDEAYQLTTTQILTQNLGTDYCLSLEDSEGVTLTNSCFDISFVDPEWNTELPMAPFVNVIPYTSTARRLVLRQNTAELASRIVSAHAPTVTVLAPNEGGTLIGINTLSWDSNDVDGDELHYIVSYSADAGQSWYNLALGITETHMLVDFAMLPGSDHGQVRVIASDGINTTSDTSDDAFSVAVHPPEATIQSPLDGLQIRLGESLLLQGKGYDLEDGIIPEEALLWTSSFSGTLGTGNALVIRNAPEGTHWITLTASDAQGGISTDSVNVTVKVYRLYLPLVMRNH